MPIPMDDPKWVETGWGHDVSGVDELVRMVSRIGTIQSGKQYVWRGVSNTKWRLQSSLYRYLSHQGRTAKGPISEKQLRHIERQLLVAARDWGLGLGPGGFVNDLHLLATLQHHGIPTRLLDVTSNPMTALWFACEEGGAPGTTGALFAFDVTDITSYPSLQPPDNTYNSQKHGLGWPLRKALANSESKGLPFLVRPSLPDSRMSAQEGSFISSVVPPGTSAVGVDGLFLAASSPPTQAAWTALKDPVPRRRGAPAKLPLVVLTIRPHIKKRMLDHLQSNYNRSRKTVFPDLAGMVDTFKEELLELPLKLAKEKDYNA